MRTNVHIGGAGTDPLRYRGYNADTYVSTGQGFLGYNMFAYCGNNSVNCADPYGNYFSWIPDFFDTIEDILALVNYIQNSYADSDEATSTNGKIINDQNGVTGKAFAYGLYNAQHNACEAIAVHNIKVESGMESTLSDTIFAFQSVHAMFGAGYFGSNPYAIGEVLTNEGISYTRVGLDGFDQPGLYIVSYWTGDPFLSSLHTVAVKYDGEQYLTYNRYGNGKTWKGFPANSDNFICGYYVGG